MKTEIELHVRNTGKPKYMIDQTVESGSYTILWGCSKLLKILAFLNQIMCPLQFPGTDHQ